MKTLLLVESHGATRRHLEEELAQAGYTVQATEGPGHALEFICTQCPDAVIVAADLEPLNGEPLTTLIATHAIRPQLPVLVIDKAHLGRARGRQAILALKPNAYVEDPLQRGELQEKLRTLRLAPEIVLAQGVSTMLARPPVLAGELKSANIPDLLCGFFGLRRSGLLVFVHDALVSHVHWREGAPVGFSTTAAEGGWPAFFGARGHSPTVSEVPSALLSFPPAATVVGEGPLAGVWRDYVKEGMAGLVGQRAGRFALYAGDEFQAEVPAALVPALAPVLEGARRAFRTQRFGGWLKPHLDQCPVRTLSFSENLGALGLGTEDLKVAMQVDGVVTLRELLTHGRGSLVQGYSLFWFLRLCGALKFEEAPSGSKGPGARTLSRRRRKPLPPELATQLREEALRIITGSYFRVLGLDLAADAEAVERAYRDVGARFHPDTYAEYDTSALKDVLESVQEKLTAAYRVLSVDEKRQAYLKYLFSRAAPGRIPPVHVDAEVALRRGEAHLRRKDARSALLAFGEAVQLNPREPEYYTYLAWHTYRSGEGVAKERARSADKLLRRALAIAPHTERAQIIRAIIESDQGEAAAARRRLLDVLDRNPRSQLAKAALRHVGR